MTMKGRKDPSGRCELSSISSTDTGADVAAYLALGGSGGEIPGTPIEDGRDRTLDLSA